MVAQALLLWLVVYVGLLAVAGFLLLLLRGSTDRRWSNRAILRLSSGLAFVVSAAVWIFLLATG